MKKYCAVWLLFMIMYPFIECTEEVVDTRAEKLISTFQIVRFPNDVCIGTNSRNGTCYTSAECSDKGGTSSGSCADGFGVCCVFLVQSCGSSSSENLTYWKKPTTFSDGMCDLTVCPTNDDICAIRLDFTSFTITGPSTHTVHQFQRKLGIPFGNMEDVDGSEFGDNSATNCLLDTFFVTGASPSSTPPTICGVNTGFHMYTDADIDRCNRLVFHLADSASSSATISNGRGATSLATQAWDITATQIECSSATVPPVGCTQWFYGSGVYELKNYNQQEPSSVTATNIHLANQHQRICIRRERAKCLGCFHAGANEMNISGPHDAEVHYTSAGICCGYATIDGNVFGDTTALAQHNGEYAAAIGMYGFDCIVIPGAFVPADQGSAPGTPHNAQTSAQMSQLLKGSPISDNFPTPTGPQICGNGGSMGIGGVKLEGGDTSASYDNSENNQEGTAIDVTICSRIAPFVLEFLSDNIESGGVGIGEFDEATNAPNQGFIIQHQQIDC